MSGGARPSLSPELSKALGEFITLVHSSVLLRSELEVYDFTQELCAEAWNLQLLCREAHRKQLEDLSARVRAAKSPLDSGIDDALAALGL